MAALGGANECGEILLRLSLIFLSHVHRAGRTSLRMFDGRFFFGTLQKAAHYPQAPPLGALFCGTFMRVA